jgi:hypothetical protein
MIPVIKQDMNLQKESNVNQSVVFSPQARAAFESRAYSFALLHAAGRASWPISRIEERPAARSAKLDAIGTPSYRRTNVLYKHVLNLFNGNQPLRFPLPRS